MIGHPETVDRRDDRAGGPTFTELIGLFAIVALAAVLRFVALPGRGTWDADQGHDMLVLRDLVMRGQIPLLGPPTSIGDFHHGVLYYYLLAPVAALSGSDPVAVTAAIALAGTAAVAVTWWLARAIGGSVAGLVAGVLMAVSASAVEESTFIWNPNLIALSSSIALAAAWHAWTTGRARWWVVAAAAVIVTMQCHVLGSVLVVPIGGLYLAALRHRRGSRDLVLAGLAGVVLAVASYVPLAIHEVTRDFSETRAALDFLTGGGGPASIALPARIVIVAVRVLAWPLSGLITDGPMAALVAAVGVVAAAVWRAIAALGSERTAARWLGLSLGWTMVALAVAAGSLATVVPGLPNDHYHAFADPIVFVVVGLGVVGLARLGGLAGGRQGHQLASAGGRPPRVRLGSLGRGAIPATLAVALIVGWNIARQPPLVAADGGWPAAELAAGRILERIGNREAFVSGLPAFKSADAVVFPLVRNGADLPLLSDPMGFDRVPQIVLCDQLFRDAIGADCGGPAEDAWIARLAPGTQPRDRFQAAPGRWVSVYLPP